jgi:hypothetical protein
MKNILFFSLGYVTVSQREPQEIDLNRSAKKTGIRTTGPSVFSHDTPEGEFHDTPGTAEFRVFDPDSDTPPWSPLGYLVHHNIRPKRVHSVVGGYFNF